MRCLPRKDVLFGGLVDNATHFRGSNPEPPILGVWNRHFQAKRAKFITFRLSKLLHRSQHSFLYNDTDHQILFMGGPNMRQLALEVGGRPPFCKKMINHHISATARPVVTKFGTVTQNGPPRSLKIWILKIQAGRRPLSWGRRYNKQVKMRFSHSESVYKMPRYEWTLKY